MHDKNLRKYELSLKKWYKKFENFTSASPKNLYSIWLYSKGVFKAVNLVLSSFPWDSLLSSTDVNYSWSMFKKVFIEVMSCTIPSKLVPTKNSPP